MRKKLDANDLQVSADKLTSLIVQIWKRDYLAQLSARALLGVLFVAFLLVLALLGPAPCTIYANDVFLLLDGGWRILNGLVPHRDFFLSLGPMTYISVAAGLWITHNTATGLTVGLLLFAAVIAVFAYLTSRTRMTAAGSILFSTFILLLCTAPMPLGGNAGFDLSYAMIYNRFGYGLLSIIFITQLLRRNDLHSHPERDGLGGAITGACLAILFFLKITYFSVGVGLVLICTLRDLRNIRRLLAIACGLGPVTLVLLAFLRFDIHAILYDFITTAYARSSGLSLAGMAGNLFGLNTTSLIALTLSCIVPRGSGHERRFWLLGALIYTIMAEVFFAGTNTTHGTTYPLYTVFILILLADLEKTLRAKRDVAPQFVAAIVLTSLGLILPIFYTHLRSLLLLTSYKTNSQLKARAYRIEGEHLRSLTFYYYMAPDELSKADNPRDYAAYLNDGLDLLRNYSSPSDIVASPSFHNPFSYALLRRPPRGGSTWFQLDNNISARHLLSDARMFGDATIVMVPKYPSSHVTTDQFLFSAYKPYLLKNFASVAESNWWQLFRKRQ